MIGKQIVKFGKRDLVVEIENETKVGVNVRNVKNALPEEWGDVVRRPSKAMGQMCVIFLGRRLIGHTFTLWDMPLGPFN